MRLNYDYYKYVVVYNKKLTLNLFLEKVGAERGYARNMFTRMFESFYSEIVDLEREYNEYYAFEYPTIKSFLYKKYNLEEDDIDELLSLRLECENYCIYRIDDFSYGDYNVIQFAFSDTLYSRVSVLLLTKDIS